MVKARKAAKPKQAIGLLGEALTEDAMATLKERRKAIKTIEKTEPMRRRILAALAEMGPTTPRDLAETLESSRETMSRLLGDLRKSGLVEEGTDSGDRRLRPYALTAEGEVEFSRHHAYGEKDKPSPSLDKDELASLYRDALERAIRLRRETNELDEARDRLDAVLREATKIEAYDIALDAQAELAKTLRQSNDYEAMNQVIDQLEAISLGNADSYDASHVLPAAAHYRYALGRCGERRGDELPIRAKHLATATSLYGQLTASEKNSKRAKQWLERQAWSVLSLAGSLRKQTQLTRALHFAATAKYTFDSLDDDYGRVHCLFMFGFCLRLLGEFKEAWTCLSRANELAQQRSFERARSETLMQMGEVCRCQGEVDKAREHLNESVELAEHLQLEVTHAFAFSALAAVDFQVHDLGAAQAFLSVAHDTFEHCEHDQGRALNARRQAAVARKIAAESSKPNYLVIERWIDGAIGEYEQMRSPAGLAACQIENGWVQMMRKGGRVQPVLEALSNLLGDDQQRKTIELDPWVPLLLRNFAHETQEEKFVEVADAVYSGGSKRLPKDAARGLKWVSAVMDDFKLEEEGESDPLVAQMGSETRRQVTESEQEFILQQESLEDQHTFALAK